MKKITATMDFEASGLIQLSYPIEVGVYIGDEDGEIASFSTLIKPRPAWVREGIWLDEAQAIHGITPDELASGMDADLVCRRLDALLSGQTVVVDGGSWDAYWLGRLYDWTPPAFRLARDEDIPHNQLHALRSRGVAAHRALPDAKWLHGALHEIEAKRSA